MAVGRAAVGGGGAAGGGVGVGAMGVGVGVGDDLTVSNKILLQKAIENNSINAMIIKPNQIGTLTETLETMKLGRENNIELIVSHRSGETDDDFIADLAYAFGKRLPVGDN